MLGFESKRCGSLPSSALPVDECAGPTTQLFEPRSPRERRRGQAAHAAERRVEPGEHRRVRREPREELRRERVRRRDRHVRGGDRERVERRRGREHVGDDRRLEHRHLGAVRDLVGRVVRQIVEHVEADRCAVLGLPIADRALHDEREVVLARQRRAVPARAHVGDPRVHAVRVRVEVTLRLGRDRLVERGLERIARARREEEAVRVVLPEDELPGAHERPERAAHEVAHEIHEEEAVLRVQVAERGEAVVVRRAAHVERALLVVDGLHRLREPGDGDVAAAVGAAAAALRARASHHHVRARRRVAAVRGRRRRRRLTARAARAGDRVHRLAVTAAGDDPDSATHHEDERPRPKEALHRNHSSS